MTKTQLLLISALTGWAAAGMGIELPLELRGTAVIPHVQSTEMRYRREADFSLGARVQVFLQNESDQVVSLSPETTVRLRGHSPDELLQSDDWAWHDFPGAWTNQSLDLPPGALTVWSWNGKRAAWGTNTDADLEVKLPGASIRNRFRIEIARPQVWLSAVTFLGSATNPFPDSLIFHIANDLADPVRIEACRLWLPAGNPSWRALLPQPWLTNLVSFPADGVIPARDRGGASVATGTLPLTYTALEIRLRDAHNTTFSLWSHLRIKREWFDISGGWVSSRVGSSNTLQCEPYLKTLKRMHVNTGHIADTPGYTDQNGPDGLYTRYPLKYFNKLEPFSHYDTDALLPRIHAVEFLGEPQYGGGRPVPPMQVWRQLAAYEPTRLPTTVTHSEERIWRFYAGLSVFRTSTPTGHGAVAGPVDQVLPPGGKTIRWGAPLETIGEMCRSLRELNRPIPPPIGLGGARRLGGLRRAQANIAHAG